MLQLSPFLKRALNESQLQAALHHSGPLMVIAGAGSGKTRVLMYRLLVLRQRGVKAEELLCLTFTQKAAREMKERADHLSRRAQLPSLKGATITTFHSLALQLLKRYGKEFPCSAYGANFLIYDRINAREALVEVFKEKKLDWNAAALNAAREYISGEKNALRTSTAARANHAQEKRFKALYQGYQAFLQNRNALDFDDLLLFSVKLLQGHPSLRARLQQQFQFLMVDEYQDTNYAQETLMRLLAGERGNVMVVGDDDQSIYAWRGALENAFFSFKEHYPQSKLVKLEENYRSTPLLLKAANALIKNNPARNEKELRSQSTGGEKLLLLQAKDPLDEAQQIAKHLQGRGFRLSLSYRNFAVLYRTKAQSRPLEEVFIKYKIPFQVWGRLGFYERREVREVLAYANSLVNPADELACLRIINIPRRVREKTLTKLREITKETGQGILSWLEEHFYENKPLPSGLFKRAEEEKLSVFMHLRKGYRFLEGKELPSVFFSFLEQVEYFAYLKNSRESAKQQAMRLMNVEKLRAVMERYTARKKKPTLENFLLELTLFLAKEDEAVDLAEDSVKLMSIHAAKGLEFPYVYLVGVEENLLPFHHGESNSMHLPEERRLAYVALTRAQKQGILSYCQTRNNYDKTTAVKPSRFLKELPAECVSVANAEPPSKQALKKKKALHLEALQRLKARLN